MKGSKKAHAQLLLPVQARSSKRMARLSSIIVFDLSLSLFHLSFYPVVGIKLRTAALPLRPCRLQQHDLNHKQQLSMEALGHETAWEILEILKKMLTVEL